MGWVDIVRPLFSNRMTIFAVTFLGIITKLLIAVNVLVCFMLIFVVLLQRPKNEGLGAAFGGDTASNIFGAQTTNVLANLTRWLAGIFMVVTLALSLLYSRNEESRTATNAFIEKARKEKETEEAQKKTEADAKAAADATAKPVTTSGAAAPAGDVDAQKAMQKQIEDALKKAIPADGAPTPAIEAGKTPAPVPAKPDATPAPTPDAAKPADPAKPADAPAPTPAPTPDAPKPDAAKPAEPAKPADAPAPEPAKPN